MASNRTISGLIKPIDSYIMNKRREMTFTELSFPENLGPHAIIMNFSQYDFDRRKTTIRKILKESIALPLPQNLLNSYKVRVNSNELGFMGAAAANATGVLKGLGTDTTLDKLVSGVSSEISGMTDDVGNFSDAAKHLTMRHLVAQLHSGIAKGFEVGKGFAINPHIALSFDGVDLKTHSFEWVLSPRNSEESRKVKNIVNTCAKNMLPEFATLTEGKASVTGTFLSKVFLKYPSVVDIFFVGTEPGYLYYFKRCMIADMTTDYAGAGQLSFVENGRPAAVKLQLQFTETEIHTREDYDAE